MEDPDRTPTLIPMTTWVLKPIENGPDLGYFCIEHDDIRKDV